MTKEFWKPVPIKGLSKTFEVSNLGNVRHAQRPVSHRNVQGYRQVTFFYRGHKLTVRVHRLVATAFIGPPKIGQQVNHKNCNRADNTVENLEWTTSAGNAQHSIAMGTKPMGLNHHLGKIDPKVALAMRSEGHTFQEIADVFGATLQAASQMISRLKKRASKHRIIQP